MKTTLTWAIAAILLGALGGAALGYWEARPWTARPAANLAVADGESPPVADDRPLAQVDESTFHFGKMESGATQQHTFPIRNAGRAPLSIEFVSHTCKCTTVELNGKQVEPGDGASVRPGEQAEVLLEWEAKQGAGPFRHGATFTTSDPTHSRLELIVEGDIVESTTLHPSLLNFGAVPIDQTGKAEMYVMSFLQPNVEILSHEVQDAEMAKQVQITVEPVAKEDLPQPDALGGVKIVAVYTPAGAVGPFEGALRLQTNLAEASYRVVPVVGTVKGDITVFGVAGWNEATATLRLPPGTTAAGTSAKLRIAVRGEHAKSTALSVSRADPAELKVTIGESQVIRDDLVHIPLSVEVPPGTRPMVRSGEGQGGDAEIVLSTTHPRTPELKLRVSFTIRE